MRNKCAFKFPIPTAPPKDEKEKHNKSLGEELYNSSDPRDQSRNFTISFENFTKPPD
jgi:hypothetical protein